MDRSKRSLAAAILLFSGEAAFAQQPVHGAPSAFDGAYEGVTGHLANDMSRHHSCPGNFVPKRLTISGGRARVAWAGGAAEGSVAANGQLRMVAGNATVLTLMVDAQGARGQSQSMYCIYELTWEKH